MRARETLADNTCGIFNSRHLDFQGLVSNCCNFASALLALLGSHPCWCPALHNQTDFGSRKMVVFTEERKRGIATAWFLACEFAASADDPIFARNCGGHNSGFIFQRRTRNGNELQPQPSVHQPNQTSS
jgi:hypothetical protein